MGMRVEGHDLFIAPSPTSTSGRMFAGCSCGYRSTTRVNAREAESAAIHHAKLVMRDRKANGMERGLVASSAPATRSA